MFDRRLFLTGAAALVMPAVITSARAQSPEVPLKLHHLLGPKAPAHTKMLQPWSEKIQADSGGRAAWTGGCVLYSRRARS